MAQINTRIQQKFDTYENWQASTLILKSGELAIASIPSGDNTGLTPPAIGIKVGDGTKKFSELNWIQSTAGDVYAWAKAATKPAYNASEITGLSEYISGQIQDTNTTYTFTQSGSVLTIKKKEKGESEYTDFATFDITSLLSAKVDKVTTATENNFASFDATGNIKDSGKKASDFANATHSHAMADVTGLTDKISEIDGKFDTLNGTGEGSVQKKVDTAINDFATKISDDGTVNTFKELVDYVADHGSEAATMAANIQTNTNDITALKGRADALEADQHTHANKTVIDGITAEKVTAWDDVVSNAVKSVTGVTATVSNNVANVTAVPTDLLVDGTQTLILNCGNASTVL